MKKVRFNLSQFQHKMYPAFLVLLFAFSAKNLDAQNLILNPGFENNTFGNGCFTNQSAANVNSNFTNVTTFYGGTTDGLDIGVNTNCYSGAAHAGTTHIVMAGLSGPNMFESISFTLSSPIVSGQSYNISFYADNANPGGSESLKIGISSASNSFGTQAVLVPLSTSSTYTLYSATFTATTGGSYLTVQPGALGQFWFGLDDFDLQVNCSSSGVTPTVSTLPAISAQCSVTSLTAPTATTSCGNSVTGTHNAVLPITAQGTTVVTWTYNDGNGHSSTQTQNVIIADNIAPVANAASLADITNTCSVTSLTAPTATDNCAGTITGTHNVTLPITAQGTTVVTWTYNDGHGNTSTQTQNVILADNTAPLADVASLADVTNLCSVPSLTAPTATDNCAGTLTGTTATVFPITTVGTTVVTWTYDDGHGNTSTQTQNVIVTVPAATTTVSGLTITATTSGATYQWIDCGNGNAPISGETSQSFTASANGMYAVMVTQNGCSSTSSCVTISSVGMEELNQSLFVLYPNPNTGIFTVVNELPVTITITNATGQLVSLHQFQSGKNTIELQGVESGIYFVSALDSNGKNSIQRVSIIK